LVTKNKGDGAAGPSKTGVLLVPKNTRSHAPAFNRTSRAVPKLAPDHSDPGAIVDSLLADLPLGAYKVEVCADVKDQVKERNENNNCKRTGNFYVIQESWRGSVNGVGAVGSASGAETWNTLGAHFDLVKYHGGGQFEYAFTGTVDWNDSGVTTGGCDVSGHGETDFNQPADMGLALDYFHGEYQALVHTEGFYTITLTPVPNSPYCNGGTALGPATRDILLIKKPADLKFDQNELKGSNPGDTPLSTWKWDFK
jgi:CARDB